MSGAAPKTRAEKMMAAARTIGILYFALAAGCAGVTDAPLDVTALTLRLRDTHGIGVFTKLALRNEVDDLLDRFRAHHQSGQKADITTLRQSYDLLVLKVLAVVQDSDPPLARAIAGSWEAVWGVLADPEKFNSSNLTWGEPS